ncbi:MAG: M16 family metallopeptidase [Candidatus Aminicenantes bacterium]
MRNKPKFSGAFSILPLVWLLSFLPGFADQSSLPQKIILENGLTLIHEKDDSSSLTVLNMVIGGGKKAEPLDKRGLAYLTTRLAIEIPDRGKVQSLMSQASRVSMSSKGDYSFIKIACLSESLEETLKIMMKIITDPLFSGLRLNWIKERMLHQRTTEEDDPLQVAHKAFLSRLLADEGYSGSSLGSEESLDRIEKKDVVNFYRNHFRGKNIVVAVSSDLEEEKFLKICTEYFNKISPGSSPPSRQKSEQAVESPLGEKEKKIILHKETKQSLVSVGYPLPPLTPRNFTLAFMLDNFLGKGVGSKLWPLRSEQKLAYNVNSRATRMKRGGLLEAYLETDQEKEERALEELKKVLHDLFQKGMSEEELQVAKIQSKASFLRDNERKEVRTLNLAAFQALDFGYDFFYRFPRIIDSITLEEMNAYLKNIFDPAKEVEVIVGPHQEQNK